MMSSFWKQLEGAVLNDKYPLERCLGADDNKATFLTELPGAEPRRATLKIIRGDPGTSGKILWRWSLVSALSHRNLISLYAFERAQIQDTPVVFAVMQYAEEDLADVLRERPLTEPEAGAVLDSTLEALAYLHGRGLVHGHVKPSNILAVGDTIKVSSDGISRAEEGADDPGVWTPYDAPERGRAPVSPANDVWSLGMTLFEILTQRLPNVNGSLAESDLAAIPARFREVVGHCLRQAPEQRWTVARIAASLRPAPAAAGPVPAAAAPEPSRPRKWIYAAALACVLLLGGFLVRRSNPPSRAESHPAPVAAGIPSSADKPSPATPPASRPQAELAGSRPAPAAPSVPPQVEKPSPMPEPPRPVARPKAAPASVAVSGSENRSSRPVWRVIVYTYNEPRFAEKKIEEINAKWPVFQAEVFSVNAGEPPYLVALGGRLSREEALRLLQQARAAGLPRDGYVQNFSH